MNQDQVKERLLMIEPEVEDFTVTFSGKQSKKVDGLYYPDRQEIIIHNRNMPDDNSLLYTAIHEFAHHVQFCRTAAPVSNRAHTKAFWNIFHRLLYRAEELGLYETVFEKNQEFIDLTETIRRDYLARNGEMMKEFGRLLMKASELCRKYHASFEDYTDRVLGLHRTEAKTIMKTYTMDIKPEIGYENMKTVAKIRDEYLRKGAEECFINNMSPDMVRSEIRPDREFSSRLQFLESEKEKLENSLEKLTVKLAKIERDIDTLKKGDPRTLDRNS